MNLVYYFCGTTCRHRPNACCYNLSNKDFKIRIMYVYRNNPCTNCLINQRVFGSLMANIIA